MVPLRNLKLSHLHSSQCSYMLSGRGGRHISGFLHTKQGINNNQASLIFGGVPTPETYTPVSTMTFVLVWPWHVWRKLYHVYHAGRVYYLTSATGLGSSFLLFDYECSFRKSPCWSWSACATYYTCRCFAASSLWKRALLRETNFQPQGFQWVWLETNGATWICWLQKSLWGIFALAWYFALWSDWKFGQKHPMPPSKSPWNLPTVCLQSQMFCMETT